MRLWSCPPILGKPLTLALLCLLPVVLQAGAALDFAKLIPATLPRSAVFKQEGWCLWDPCVVRGDDGLYHLLYSRWRQSLGFDAWATHAEIA